VAHWKDKRNVKFIAKKNGLTMIEIDKIKKNHLQNYSTTTTNEV